MSTNLNIQQDSNTNKNVDVLKGKTLGIMEYDKQELKVGTYVELEHYGETRDLKKSMVIAKQHLKEDPTYYSKLYQSGLIDEPKAIELAKKYFTDNPQYYTENILSEIQDIIREYEWGEPESYEYGQDSDWWSKQIAGESVEIEEELLEEVEILEVDIEETEEVDIELLEESNST